MKKNLLILFIFQILFGVISFVCYFFAGLVFESNLDIIIVLSSVLFLVISFVLYKFYIPDFLNMDLLRKHKNSLLIYFTGITVLSVVLSMIESDIAGVFAEILQQSYGIAVSVIDLISIEKNYAIIVLIIFIIENFIKYLLLLKNKKTVA